ncbi:MAG: DUF362 domain-containing protein [Deltaproteobacteria bacterium]|nr:DUF362 domain-containing protein [Deltaproteobacteria bacterium]
MTKVSLTRCDSYSNAELKDVIYESLENIGFDPSTFKNKRIAVKPNMLMPAKNEKAIMTHPEFFRAVVQIIKENKGKPFLIESPAVHSLARAIKKSGYAEIVESENLEVADPSTTKTLHFEEAQRYKHIEISSAYFDADMIVCLPKFKSHGITYMTGAVKLLFGGIYGPGKSKMHFRLPDHKDFSQFLLDLYGAFVHGFDPPKPILHIMDAIVVQEGEGPGPAGKPRTMNAVLAGKNGIAVDYVATKVAGLDIKKAPTISEGFKRGYGVTSKDEIEVVGDTIESLALSDFIPATGSSIMSNMFIWPLTTPMVKNLVVERPSPDPKKCTLCYQCMKICPAEAIGPAKKNGLTPEYDSKKCIRCYCCLEICPEAAVQKIRGRLQWVLELMF